MKPLAITFVFMCALAVSCVSAVAQITITAADVNAKLAAGNTIVNINDTTTWHANIGMPGPTATSWDFSGLLTQGSTTLVSVAPGTTPFVGEFPGVTHALKTSLSGSIPGAPGPVTGDLYLYLKVGTSLLSPGTKGGGTVTVPPFGDLPGTLTITNTPADTTYALPSTIGTRWTSVYTAATAIVVANIPFSSSTVNHDISDVVDAFGPMKIPGGSIHDALRIRRDDRLPSRTVGYIFLAKDGASVQLSAVDTTQLDNGFIEILKGSVTWNAAFFSTDVQAIDGVPGEFTLRQNYPNPFNPGTTISYQIAAPGDVTLKVFDLLGREVATLVDERKPAGAYRISFDGSGLASGVYLYRLATAGLVQTRRMMLLK